MDRLARFKWINGCLHFAHTRWNFQPKTKQDVFRFAWLSTGSRSNVSSIVIFVASCPVSQILQVFCWTQHPTPIPPEFWGCSPRTRLPMLGFRGTKALRRHITRQNHQNVAKNPPFWWKSSDEKIKFWTGKMANMGTVRIDVRYFKFRGDVFPCCRTLHTIIPLHSAAALFYRRGAGGVMSMMAFCCCCSRADDDKRVWRWNYWSQRSRRRWRKPQSSPTERQ